MNAEDAAQLLTDAAHRLGEHFDAVQILATRTENGRTFCSKRGVGNWYARQGMAREFIHEDLAQENAVQLAKVLNDGHQN